MRLRGGSRFPRKRRRVGRGFSLIGRIFAVECSGSVPIRRISVDPRPILLSAYIQSPLRPVVDRRLRRGGQGGQLIFLAMLGNFFARSFRRRAHRLPSRRGRSPTASWLGLSQLSKSAKPQAAGQGGQRVGMYSLVHYHFWRPFSRVCWGEFGEIVVIFLEPPTTLREYGENEPTLLPPLFAPSRLCVRSQKSCLTQRREGAKKYEKKSVRSLLLLAILGG
jgi:hypothetical protein